MSHDDLVSQTTTPGPVHLRSYVLYHVLHHNQDHTMVLKYRDPVPDDLVNTWGSTAQTMEEALQNLVAYFNQYQRGLTIPEDPK